MKVLKSNTPNLAERTLRAEPKFMQKYSDEVRERIARKAYELYVQEGQQDGQDIDWLQAEEIVMRTAHEARK